MTTSKKPPTAPISTKAGKSENISAQDAAGNHYLSIVADRHECLCGARRGSAQEATEHILDEIIRERMNKNIQLDHESERSER